MGNRTKIGILVKLGFLIVIFGFFMPITCQMNGFQIANYAIHNNSVYVAVMLYILITSAFLSVIVAVTYYLIKRKTTPVLIDWLFFIICVTTGLIIQIISKVKTEPQEGAFVIVVGLLITLVLLIFASLQKKE